jgi:hypothetical protein
MPRVSCWELAGQDQSSWTLRAVFERAGVTYTDALLASYSTDWEPHTYIARPERATFCLNSEPLQHGT